MINAFRIACADDASTVAELVNEAYHPQIRALSWTHEGDLVTGDRTNSQQVAAIIAKTDSVLLLGLQGTTIVACVHLELQDNQCYIGMLAVKPALQCSGAGKAMLAYAENYGVDYFKAEKFMMMVISSRTELIAFYTRRGYQKTGVLLDYALVAGRDRSKHGSLKMELLAKQLTQSRTCTLF